MKITQSYLFTLIFFVQFGFGGKLVAQQKYTVENIKQTMEETRKSVSEDPNRPAFHLLPKAGFLADPNGAIFFNGWYHTFYLHNPYSGNPGAWTWGHARSKDLVHWEQLPAAIVPYYEMGSYEVGSGSTIINEQGVPTAFYSAMHQGTMKFWRATGNSDLTVWKHEKPNPILSLDFKGLPKFDKYWRDPFVFRTAGRTFLICCADLFDQPNVVVPIFEAKNKELTSWDYKGIMFTYPKYKMRNMEVPELRQLGEKWVFFTSCDAPVAMTYGFVGNFNIEKLKFTATSEGPLDYSAHFYAQETVQDADGNLNLLGWLSGWDRDWMPNFNTSEIINTGKWWNGCFAIPRTVIVDAKGNLIQQPVSAMKGLREEQFSLARTELPVQDVTASYKILPFQGNQLEIKLNIELGNAGFCGVNVLCNDKGRGGMSIIWSGNMINVDGVEVPIKDYKPGEKLQLHIFIDKFYVEIFINGGRYCVTRKIKEKNILGDHIALTSLSGTAILNSLEAWKLKTINEK